MSSKLDWNKARKRELIWKKGGLPHWQDGWSPDEPGECVKAPHNWSSHNRQNTFQGPDDGDGIEGTLVLTISFCETVKYTFRFHQLSAGEKGEKYLIKMAQKCFEAGPLGTLDFELKIRKHYAFVKHQNTYTKDGAISGCVADARLRAAEMKKRYPTINLREFDEHIRNSTD